jgi:hypothetical protein
VTFSGTQFPGTKNDGSKRAFIVQWERLEREVVMLADSSWKGVKQEGCEGGHSVALRGWRGACSDQQ